MAASVFYSQAQASEPRQCHMDIPTDAILSSENADYVEHFYGRECVDELLARAESPVLTAHRMLLGQ
jgi:hypothetical protein